MELLNILKLENGDLKILGMYIVQLGQLHRPLTTINNINDPNNLNAEICQFKQKSYI